MTVQIVDSIAWAAGIFEGEGSVYRQARNSVPIIKIGMTDLDIIVRVAETVKVGSVGAHSYKDKRAERYKPIYRWTAYYDKAKQAAILFLPYLGERRTGQICAVWPELEDR